MDLHLGTEQLSKLKTKDADGVEWIFIWNRIVVEIEDQRWHWTVDNQIKHIQKLTND